MQKIVLYKKQVLIPDIFKKSNKSKGWVGGEHLPAGLLTIFNEM